MRQNANLEVSIIVCLKGFKSQSHFKSSSSTTFFFKILLNLQYRFLHHLGGRSFIYSFTVLRNILRSIQSELDLCWSYAPKVVKILTICKIQIFCLFFLISTTKHNNYRSSPVLCLKWWCFNSNSTGIMIWIKRRKLLVIKKTPKKNLSYTLISDLWYPTCHLWMSYFTWFYKRIPSFKRRIYFCFPPLQDTNFFRSNVSL